MSFPDDVRYAKKRLKRLKLWVPRMEDFEVYLDAKIILFDRSWTSGVIDFNNDVILINPLLWKSWRLSTIYHEYGHVFYRRLARKPGMFGKPRFISRYARTNKEEDFCETFAQYCKGIRHHQEETIQHKLDFIASLRKK